MTVHTAPERAGLGPSTVLPFTRSIPVAVPNVEQLSFLHGITLGNTSTTASGENGTLATSYAPLSRHHPLTNRHPHQIGPIGALSGSSVN